MEMPRKKLLLVDDEASAVELVKEWLEPAGYHVHTAFDGESGFRQFFSCRPDLAIVDIIMPRMDGFALCRRIREISQAPIVVLSALGGEDEKVKALSTGADEYLVKPVSRLELLARVETMLRRASQGAADLGSLYSDDVVDMDFGRHEVHVRGKPVTLTPLAFRLLSYMARHPGHVLTPQQLWENVWGWDTGSLDSVKRHISYLRKQIEEVPESPRLITTVKGVGYRYLTPSRRISVA